MLTKGFLGDFAEFRVDRVPSFVDLRLELPCHVLVHFRGLGEFRAFGVVFLMQGTEASVGAVVPSLGQTLLVLLHAAQRVMAGHANIDAWFGTVPIWICLSKPGFLLVDPPIEFGHVHVSAPRTRLVFPAQGAVLPEVHGAHGLTSKAGLFPFLMRRRWAEIPCRSISVHGPPARQQRRHGRAHRG